MTDQASTPPAVIDPWNQGTRWAIDTELWAPPLQSADADHNRDWRRDRARAREMAWRDPYGANALAILQNSIVGERFRLSMRPRVRLLEVSEDEAAEWGQLVEDAWESYSHGVTFDSDARRSNTFTQIMRMVVAGLHMDGEAVAVVRAKPGAEGYDTTFQVIEPERIESPGPPPRDRRERFGIEYDEFGEPLAYSIRKTHPSDDTRWGVRTVAEYERVPRATEWGRPVVVHIFDEYRPSMMRGVSRTVSVLRQMNMLGAYSDTELQRNVIQAGIGAVIESELDYEQAMAVVGADHQWGNNLTAAAMDHLARVAPYYQRTGLRINGSRIAHLAPGDKVHMIQPNGMATDFEKFEKAMLRQLAAGLGVPFESLARNFSDTSYSAARMSLADIWRSFLVARSLVSTKFAMPLFGAWLEEAVVTGRVPFLGGGRPTVEAFAARRNALVAGRFISWGKPIIDPVKERAGQQAALALGLTTLEAEAAAEGLDFDEVARQRAREVRMRAALGLNQGGYDPTLSMAPVVTKDQGQATQTRGGGTAE